METVYTFFLIRVVLFLSFLILSNPLFAQVSFNYSKLKKSDGTALSVSNPSSLQFGPDKRLYLSTQDGTVYAYSVERVGENDYRISNTETITLVKSIPNYDDDGKLNTSIVTRQVTGILVSGTTSNPVLYVGSSDPRIGGGGTSADKNLDTNSGIISRLTWNGTSWGKVDLVRGLPRSEENHANNGMELDEENNLLYVAQGGHTNAGAPSNNFAFLNEYALSAAVLSIDLNDIDALPTLTDAQGQKYKYNLPTVDDPTRPNNQDGTDPGDPFGGNDGLNQARLVVNGPVQIYSPGYRNIYDLVITKAHGREGRMYTVDNGANGGWGGHPHNEGSDGTVTNNYVEGEPGSTGAGPNDAKVNNKDNLHLVTKGFYAGHPTPIRANPEGAGLYTYGTEGIWRTSKTDPLYPLPADWPPVPLSMAIPVEGDFRNPGVNDGALYTWAYSTNGIAEYTASNFSGSLAGNLLVTSWDGKIYRIELSLDGKQVVSVLELASGFSNPLDVIAQGDEDIFPGTVWSAVYGGKTITIFEPIDYVNCTGLYDITLDDDSDGYSNADEVDNGSDPCSPASKPADYDGDLLSDLNDSDDDNDKLSDTQDYFVLDFYNGLNTSLPVDYPLLNNNPGTGFFGLGFTGLMANGTTDYLDAFNKEILIAGGAVGAFTVDGVTSGDAYQSGNNQENAFQLGINVQSSTGPFTAGAKMLSPFFNSQTPKNYQSQGFYLGAGDQDNYVKIALVANGGLGGLEVLVESGGIVKSQFLYAPDKSGEQYISDNVLTATTLDLFLSVNPVNGTVQAKYQIDGDVIKYLGSPIVLEGSLLTAVQGTPALAVGLIASSRGSNTPFTATWDHLNVTLDPLDNTGAWQTITSTNNPEARHGNGFVQVGNKFYLLGGRGIKNVNIYDPATNSWSLGAKTPVEMHHFQALEYHGLLYVVGAFTGGYPGETPLANIYIYNPVTNVWIKGPEIPQARRRGSSGAFVYKDKIYLVGGIVDGHTSGHVSWFDEFDPATNSWKVLADAPRSRDHFHAALIEDKVYAIAGRLSKSAEGVFKNTIPEVDMYNFSTEKWTTLPAPEGNIPTQRAGAGVAVLGNEIIVMGGESNNQTAAHNETEALSNLTHTWRTLTPMSQGRHGTQAIVSNEGIYIAAGNGTQGGGYELTTHEAFYMFNQTSPTGTSVAESVLGYPLEVNLGNTTVNQKVSKKLTLSNSAGNQGIQVSALSIPGSSEFAVSSPHPLPFLLKPGASVELEVNLTSITVGSVQASLEISHTGSGGKATINLYGEVEDNSLLLLSTDALHFLSQEANTISPPQTVEVTNNSKSALDITGLVNSGTNATEFLHDFTAPVTLNPGASVMVGVSFTPASEGLKVATLKISQSVSSTIFTVALSGEGISNDGTNTAPVASAGPDQTVTAGSDGTASVALDGSGSSDADGSISSYSWKEGGVELATGVNPAISLAEGMHTISLTVTDNEGATATDEVVVTVNGLSSFNPIRLNAGGGQYTTGGGTVFAADQYFNGSTGTKNYSAEIAGTTDDVLYQTERYGTNFSYDIPVPSGTYLIRLHFAEIYFTAIGKRVFDVTAEGNLLMDNFDIYAEAGHATALVKEMEVAVTDGTLNLAFIASVNNGKLSAVEIIETTSTPDNTAPVANAGVDQRITLPTNSVTLNGSGTDSDGTISSYSWSQDSGPGSAIFSSTGLAAPTVSELIAGTYVFSLTVTDDKGSVSAPDQVSVVVQEAPPGNTAPLASAGSDQTVTAGRDGTALVALDGSGSSDADGSISSYSWKEGGVEVATGVNPTISLAEGMYTISLTVTDNKGATATDEVVVTVNPEATATCQSLALDGSIQLMLNKSLLLSGDFTIEYWAKLSGSISNADAPVSGGNSQYLNYYQAQARLYSSGASGGNDPIVSSHTTQADVWTHYAFVREGTNMRVYINGLEDTGAKATNLWAGDFTITNLGQGAGYLAGELDELRVWNEARSSIAISDNYKSGVATTTTGLLAYFNFEEVSGIVKDVSGNGYDSQSLPAGISRTGSTAPLTDCDPNSNTAPVVDAGENQSITLPANSTSFTATASDPDGTIASYLWEKVSGPAATLTGTTTATLSLSNLLEGSYTFKVTVTDNGGATASDEVNLTVNPAVDASCLSLAMDGSNSLVLSKSIVLSGDFTIEYWAKLSTGINNADAPLSGGSSQFINYYSAKARLYSSGAPGGNDPIVSSHTTQADVWTHYAFVREGTNMRVYINGLEDTGAKATNQWTGNFTISNLGQGYQDNFSGELDEIRVWSLARSGTVIADNYNKTVAATSSGLTAYFDFQEQSGIVTDKTGNDYDSQSLPAGIARTSSGAPLTGCDPSSNTAPLANAGPDQTVTAGSDGTASVALDGSGSSDADGSISSYSWKEGGVELAIGVNPTISLAEGMHTISLTVTDNEGATAIDEVVVTVNPAGNTAPVVDAGGDQSITLPANSTSFTATASDPDGTIASYLWEKVSGPAATLTGTTTATLSLSNLLEGSYTFKVTVTDNGGATASDEVNLTVSPEVTFAAPSNLTAEGVSASQINLNWQDNTSDEDGLVMERAVREDFTGSVAFIKLSANTTSYQDKNKKTGVTFYYRIKAVKGTLSSPYSNVASAMASSTAGSVAARNTSVNAYPNTFDDYVNLEIEAEEPQEYEIRVYDLVGKVVYQSKFISDSLHPNVHRIDLSDNTLKSGIYLIQVRNRTRNTTQIIKVVKAW